MSRSEPPRATPARLVIRSPTLETLGIATAVFRGYVNRTLHLHTTNVVLFSVILRGRGHHYMGEEIYEEQGPSVGITHYQQLHDIVTEPEGMDVVNVYLDLGRLAVPCLPEPFASVLPELLPLSPAFQNRLDQMRRIVFDEDQDLEQRVMRLHHELANRPVGFEYAALREFELFLIACCRQALIHGVTRARDKGARHGSAAVESVRAYVDRHYAEPLTLSVLANRAGLHASYLCRSFKRYTGKTVGDYLIDRRLQAALFALQTSDAKIAALALEAGFRDLAFFNRKFRERIGETPSGYRKKFFGKRVAVPA